ncbi:MAG: acyl carrier protein [Rhodospirillaceae bacterium]|nr:acyl carrier protein [Rhodospirillaceae bacterium]
MTEFNQETFELVAEIISDICSINRADITPDTHTVDDLGIDSLDFLDVTFDIDKRFGIKMPVEQWMEEVNQGNADAAEFFVMKNLVTRIEELRAEKAA